MLRIVEFRKELKKKKLTKKKPSKLILICCAVGIASLGVSCAVEQGSENASTPGVSTSNQNKSTSAKETIHNKLGVTSTVTRNKKSAVLVESQFSSLSFNCETKTPNWVAWKVSKSYLGSAERKDDFRSDTTLPCGSATPEDYRNSGYDRGHVMPSADRTVSSASNTFTFLMSNMFPQLPELNRGPWAQMEDWTREQLSRSSEIFVMSGPLGNKGTLSAGLSNPNGVVVPEFTWKVVVLSKQKVAIPNASDVRVVAVKMPNEKSVQGQPWQSFQVSVDHLEEESGWNLLSNLSDTLQANLEGAVTKE
jgi:endonuclease G, mitochondrial